MRPGTLTAAAVALSLMSAAPLSADDVIPLLPLERPSSLDSIRIAPSGGLKKKSPAKERLGIEKETATDAAVMERKDPLVILTEPKAGILTRSFQKLSGRVGSGITKAFLRINDDTRIVTVADGRFNTSVALKPGLNTITALAWDLEGNLGKTSLKVFVRPEAGGPGVTIAEPRDGATLDITRNRVLRIRALASDKSIKDGVLVVNNLPRPVRLSGGVLDEELALMPGTNEIFVEVADASGRTGISQPLTVHTYDGSPKDLVAVLSWGSAESDMDLHVWDSFGHHTFSDAKDPSQSEAAIPGGMLDMDRRGGYGPEVFSLEAAESEVYTFYAYYNPGIGPAEGSDAYLLLLLYGDEPARRIMRVFGPVRLDAKRPAWEAAHVKMPAGVFFQEKDADLKKTLGMDSRAVRRLALILKEESSQFGLLAISAMGRIKSEEAVGPLLEALGSGPVEIRRAAAGALWNIRSVDSVAGLIQSLSDEDADVRRAAAGALGNIGDSRAVRALSGLLAEEGDTQVRRAAIKALGMIGDARAQETLAAQSMDKDPALRVEALRALGRAGEEEPEYNIEQAILKALGDETAGVREAAAYAAGMIKIRDAKQELTDILYFDDDEGARAQAAASLGELGEEDSVPELERAYETDYSPMVRFCAKKALEQIGPVEQNKDSGAEDEWKMPDEEGLVVY